MISEQSPRGHLQVCIARATVLVNGDDLRLPDDILSPMWIVQALTFMRHSRKTTLVPISIVFLFYPPHTMGDKQYQTNNSNVQCDFNPLIIKYVTSDHHRKPLMPITVKVKLKIHKLLVQNSHEVLLGIAQQYEPLLCPFNRSLLNLQSGYSSFAYLSVLFRRLQSRQAKVRRNGKLKTKHRHRRLHKIGNQSYHCNGRIRQHHPRQDDLARRHNQDGVLFFRDVIASESQTRARQRTIDVLLIIRQSRHIKNEVNIDLECQRS